MTLTTISFSPNFKRFWSQITSGSTRYHDRSECKLKQHLYVKLLTGLASAGQPEQTVSVLDHQQSLRSEGLRCEALLSGEFLLSYFKHTIFVQT